jgi:hypothetical protein
MSAEEREKLGITPQKEYLGDGVYVNNDGFQLWLSTEDGLSTTNERALEPAVWKALKSYAQRCARHGEIE